MTGKLLITFLLFFLVSVFFILDFFFIFQNIQKLTMVETKQVIAVAGVFLIIQPVTEFKMIGFCCLIACMMMSGVSSSDCKSCNQ